MLTQTLLKWSARRPSAGLPSPEPPTKPRDRLRVGIPRVLNLWSTHQFWVGFFEALGIDARRLEFSSDSSEDQSRQFGKGRGTVDCCYPVKCISGHYGELLARDKHHKIDVLFSPMIYSLPSYLNGHVLASLACPRVMAAPENIKAGFLKETDVFAEHGVRYAAPLVSLGDAPLVPKQLYAGLRDALPDLTLKETRHAVEAGYRALENYGASLRAGARSVLARCAAEPHGPGHRARDRSRSAGARLSDALDAIPADRRRRARVDVPAGHRRRPYQVAVRPRRCLALVLQRQHERDPLGRQVRRAHALGGLRCANVELRVRHGPTDVLAGAADRRALGHALLLVPGPRLHQACVLGEDPRRDDCALLAEARRRHHREEKGGGTDGLSLARSLKSSFLARYLPMKPSVSSMRVPSGSST